MIIAGTGHRPAFCPCKYDETHAWLKSLKNRLKRKLKKDGVKTVISGAALGWDQWLAEVAIDMKLDVKMYVPFKDFGDNWPEYSQDKLKALLDKSSEVKYICEEYSNSAFFKRDLAMVKDCDSMYALWNPKATTGGTFLTIKLAEENNVEYINFWKDK